MRMASAAQHSGGRSRRGNGTERRRDFAGRRHCHRLLAHESHPRSRCRRICARWCSPGVVNLQLSEHVSHLGLVLRARSLQPEGLHYRRQRCGKFRRTAHLDARRHGESRDWGGGRHAQRRHRAVRRQGGRIRRLRPDGILCRLGRHGRHHHRHHGEVAAQAGSGCDVAGYLRIDRRCGAHGLRNHRGGNYAGGAGDARRLDAAYDRSFLPCGLSAGCRSGAADRTGGPARGGGGAGGSR